MLDVTCANFFFSYFCFFTFRLIFFPIFFRLLFFLFKNSDWPWMWYVDHQPNFHDFHHEKFNVNYGMTSWLDRFHQTDLLWLEKLKEDKQMDKNKKLK